MIKLKNTFCEDKEIQGITKYYFLIKRNLIILHNILFKHS